MNEEKQELVLSKPEFQLTRPEDITKFSKILTKFITDSKLSEVIKGNNYVNVDGWKFAGLNFGLIPLTAEPVMKHHDNQVLTILYHEILVRSGNGKRNIEVPYFASTNQQLVEKFRKDNMTRELTTDYFNYSCYCEIINTQTGVKVGAGTGICSNLELKKTGYDEFAINSMAQTRAIGRAFKNVIGFIVKAAGYEPTPLEEMDGGRSVIVVQGESSIDVTKMLEKANTLEDVMLLWEDLPAHIQSNQSVKGAFTRKKNNLKAKTKM